MWCGDLGVGAGVTTNVGWVDAVKAIKGPFGALCREVWFTSRALI